MSVPLHPACADETRRLATLHRLEILDTLPEQAYDDLTILASQVCNTPISILAFIDSDRQWYKSTIGTALKETARNVAFCAHAIETPDAVFVVEDATRDPRFVDNPFVTGELGIRFYAGAPIVLPNGDAIGTMCVIDTQPRVLTDAQRDCLTALARQASLLLDLREKAVAAERLAQAQAQMTVEARLKQKRGIELLELVLQGGQTGLWDLHVPSGVWTVNAREQAMLGHADASGDKLDWRSLVHPDDRQHLAEAMEPHLNGHAAFYECTHRMQHADGHYVWVLDRGVIVERNVRGEALRIVGTHVDVTAQREKDEALRRDVERLEFALSGSEQGLWDWNVATGTVFRSAQWRRLLGYTLADIDGIEGIDGIDGIDASGRPCERLVLAEDVPRRREAMDRHLRGLAPKFEVEVRMRRKDGSTVWIHERGKVVERDAAGRALRVVGTSAVASDRANLRADPAIAR